MSQHNEPGMAYDMKKLNKIFAILSVLFLITVIWVFLDDYLRPWKAVQVEAMKIKRQKLTEQIEAKQKEIDEKKLASLKEDLKEAEATVDQRRKDIAKTESDLAEVGKLLKDENIINGTLNAQVSALQFQYGEAP